MNNRQKAYAHLKRAQEILEYGQVQDFGMMEGSSKRPPPERKSPESKSSRVDHQPSRRLVLHASGFTKHQSTDSKTGVSYKTEAYNKVVDKNITLTPPFSISITDSTNEIRIQANKDWIFINHKGEIQIHSKEGEYTVDTPGAMHEIFLLTAEMIKLQLTQLQEDENFKFLQQVLDRWPEDLGQLQFMEDVIDRLFSASSKNIKVRQLQTQSLESIRVLLLLHGLMNPTD